jgi:hypothetical protein
MNHWLLLLAIVLSGCANSKETWTPEGQKGYSIDCSGMARSWRMCYEKAGELCGARGYEVVAGGSEDAGVAAIGNANSAYAGSVINRSMLVECKSP